MSELNMEDFATRKARILRTRSDRAAATAKLEPLTAREQLFEQEVWKKYVADANISSAKSFLDCKADYDASDLLSLLQRMPKGAVLHTHGLASGDFNTLIERVQKAERFYVWRGDESVVHGTFKMIPAGAEVPNGYVPASSVPAAELYASLTLPQNLASSDECWEHFGNVWKRIAEVGASSDLYFGKGGFLWDILAHWFSLGVIYVEIKEVLFVPWVTCEGTELKDEEWLDLFVKTVNEFKAENPGFIGARLVCLTLKFLSVEEVQKCYQRTVAMKRRAPNFIAGFDLAGHEDGLAPVEKYAEMLQAEQKAAAEEGVHVPFLLHGGETNQPTATQVLDAVAIGCERIGHGIAMARHPVVIDEVIAQGICIESCPISNQVLGYVSDLATHACLGLFRQGIPMTISPDDPGVWHYSDVSYDFCAVAKAWNLDLIEVKAFAKNSLSFSTLSGEDRAQALAVWELQWNTWVESELERAGK